MNNRNNKNKISIIGGGPFGLALYYRIKEKNENVFIYDKNKNEEQIKENFKQIYGENLENPLVSTSFSDCIKDANTVFVVIPCFALSSFIDEFNKIEFTKKPNLVFLSKGFVFDKNKISLISNFIKNKINYNQENHNKLFYMAGPTIHTDVFENNVKYYFNMSSFGRTDGNENIDNIISLFPKEKVFVNEDLIGLEFVCAIKNIFSIYFNWKKQKDIEFNKEKKIQNCLYEMKNLGKLFGDITNETIQNVGRDDLLTTIEKGRNGLLGSQIGKGEIIPNGINTKLKNTNYIPEGVYVLEKLYEMSKQNEYKTKFENLTITKKLFSIFGVYSIELQMRKK
jgi:glycerol-3-phosphate dehydrogenase